MECLYPVRFSSNTSNERLMSLCLETDGKAGMAVILDDSPTPIDMDLLAKEMKKHGLPSYARPCFIRLTKKIELTGEFNTDLHC